MKQPNEIAVIDSFVKLAGVMLAYDKKQDYNLTDNMAEAAAQVISSQGLTQDHLQAMLVIRENFERSIDKRYKVKRATGAMAFAQDMEAELKRKKVPVVFRIVNGLLDTVIGSLMTHRVTVPKELTDLIVD